MFSLQKSFSFTRISVDFIQELTEHKSNKYRFIRKELMPRLVGASLSAFCLIDASYHAALLAGEAFYAAYKGLLCHKAPDFSGVCRQAASVAFFLKKFPHLSTVGVVAPSSIGKFERNEVAMLLLSRQPQYAKRCTADTLSILRQLRGYISRMPLKHQAPFKDTIALLGGAEKVLREFKLVSFTSKNHLSDFLARGVRGLREKDKTLFERIVFKECLSRFLALGFSFTAAVDLTRRVLLDTVLFLELVIMDCLFMGALVNDHETLQQLVGGHFRDLFLTAVTVFSGSIVGLINPSWGCSQVDLDSEWYQSIRASLKGAKRRLGKKIDALESGKSLLMPVSFNLGSAYKAGHIVYVLITKQEDGYSVSVLNKGFGAHHAIMMSAILSSIVSGSAPREECSSDISAKMGKSLKILQKQDKCPVNFTVESLCAKDVKTYVADLMDLMGEGDRGIDSKAKQAKQKAGEYVLSRVYVKLAKLGAAAQAKLKGGGGMPNQLLVKVQKTGDCPKSSLLGAFYYHSAHKPQSNSFDKRPYKLFLRQLKDTIYKREGHLLDFNLTLKKGQEKPSAFTARKLRNGWKKFDQKFTASRAN